VIGRVSLGHLEPSQVQVGRLRLQGSLRIPERANGVVVCIDGSGSSLFDGCHLAVASALNDSGIATLLIDLLTNDDHPREDFQFLASRLVDATDWLDAQRQTTDLPLGYFGTGTGAAVALAAVAERPAIVSAIVSSSGRPLLVRAALPQVRAPTLLITSERDTALVKLNRSALSQMLCHKCLELVPATLDESAPVQDLGTLTRDWFERYLLAPADRLSSSTEFRHN
jgi:putative phosphoribosyl transferase